MLWHLCLQGAEMPEGMLQRTDSQETPPTPLFDEDVSQPLEEFPRIHYEGEGWEMHLRQPNKKKITGQRSICCSWFNPFLKTEFWAEFIKPSFVMHTYATLFAVWFASLYFCGAPFILHIDCISFWEEAMYSSEDYFYHLCVLISKADSGLPLILHSSLFPLNSYKLL